jgi:NAD(P)-dependent dehydrogenase (short-subunit alcohol dehydrogenase family)
MVEPRSYAGRVAIVTGAARGIGQGIALKLAARGASVVLVDLDEPGDTAAWLGGTAISIKADIARSEGWAHVAEEVDRVFGRADIVVNNAGIYPRALIDDLDFDLWRKTFAVNLDSHFFSAKHFVIIYEMLP